MKLTGSIFITGGAGTLGKAIIGRATAEGWDCTFTVYSRDPEKHRLLKAEFPRVRTVLGDVQDLSTLTQAMTGHSTVIHAAANKHVGSCQRQPIQAINVNVNGSVNVAKAAMTAQVRRVVGISTDKACNPISVYGMSKALMESVFLSMQDRTAASGLFADVDPGPVFSVVRYGNVIGSTGSVVKVWEKQQAEGKPFTLTDPEATRFWLSPNQAVDLVLMSLNYPNAVTVPLAPSLSMEKFLAYTMGDEVIASHDRLEITGLNEGEKKHEELLTAGEVKKALHHPDGYATVHHAPFYWVAKSGIEPLRGMISPGAYTSQVAGQLTRSELYQLLGGEK